MAFLSEAAVELALLEQLRGLGYRIEREEDKAPMASSLSARVTMRLCSRSDSRMPLHA